MDLHFKTKILISHLMVMFFDNDKRAVQSDTGNHCGFSRR